MHIDENDIARYVDDRLSDDERRDVESHLAECPRCRNQVAAVHRILENGAGQEPALDPEVRAQAEALGRPEEDEASTGWQRGRRPVVLAMAVALLLGGAGLLYEQLQEPSPSQLRSSSDAPALTVQAPADGATVSERPVFVCAPASEALGYRVTLWTPGGTVVWEGDTTAARVRLPAEVSLTAGETYLWRAEALRADGTTLQSNARTFTYAP
jgi:anti-sigma factor RsiW